MTALVSPAQQRQMRDLNNENRDLIALLNRARNDLDRALRLVEARYRRERQEIIEAEGERDGYQWDCKP
jgi:hypothetical protein